MEYRKRSKSNPLDDTDIKVDIDINIIPLSITQRIVKFFKTMLLNLNPFNRNKYIVIHN
jgi:hypothetical protein